MVWQPGTRLNQYKIDRVLGSGGFGITYKANHLSLKQRVVIKTINDTLHRDPEYNSYVDRFRKEAQILAKLGEIRHPHIVRVSDLFEAPMQERSWWQALWGVRVPQLPCLVMDFIDGKNLFEWVQENRSPLGEQEALKYIQQAGEALHLVHRAGLVHRDAHPGNIMICNGNAILIDFGLAGSIIPTVSSSKIGGNPAFAPPDQWRGNRDPNVDVYTLAASLYYALTTHTPDPFTPPQSHNPQISDRTNQAIVAALSLQASKRPASIPHWFRLLGLGLSPAARQPLPDLSEPPGKTAKTKKAEPISPATTRSIPWISIGLLALLALILGFYNPFEGILTGDADPPVEEADPTESPSPEAREIPDPVIPPPPNPTLPPPFFLGIRVEPYAYTTASVSATGEVSGYNAERERYRETALNLPSGAEPLYMVAIEGGTFLMGSPESEADRGSDESPQHKVTVPSFLMGQYEVTQAQWFAVMGSDYNVNGWQERWRSLDNRFKGDNLPIVYASWDDAQEFVRRLSQQTGKTYRLPTEAEWEYAARSGTETPFSYGDTITPKVVNYNGNVPYSNVPNGEYRSVTIAVNSLYPNPWGLYHIHGNVWELVQDQYHDSYNNKPSNLLDNGSIPWITSTDVSKSGKFAIRGGSWFFNAWNNRSANRVRLNRDDRSDFLGFRVVLVP